MCRNYGVFTRGTILVDTVITRGFYSAAALLAMQRAVIFTANPSVRHTLVPYPDK